MYGLKRIAAICVAIAVTALLAQPVVRSLGIISAHAQNAMSRGDSVRAIRRTEQSDPVL